MSAHQLFHLLARPDVTEIVLQTGRPACALVNNAYRRIGAEPHRDDDIITLLAAAGGREHLAGLADGRAWEAQIAGVGTIRVTAGYDGALLKASVRLVARASAATPKPAATAKPAQAQPQPAQPQAPRPPPAAKPANTARSDAALPEPVLPQGLPRREPSTSKPQPSAAQSPTPSAAITAQPARKPQPAPKPAELSAAFDTSAQTVVASAPHAPAAPAVPATHVVTSHDAFNFEPATGWAASHPPAAPARETRKRPVFVGDALDDLLGKTRELRASDVHVLANRPPMLRVAGELVIAGEPLDDATTEKLLLARVPPALHAQLRLHGSCDFSLIHPAYGRFRANVTRQRTGWKLTARPIGETVPTLAELGLPESIARATHHHQGLIVVTGPTGHGKTTTLAAIVGIINRDTTHHVITVEDPIEYVHPRAKAVISQREVGTHTKSFQAALKGSLREDPDVIVVGELRDTETVRMALTASETGHLVISTMNTPSAAKAIERLIDLFPPGDQPQVRMTLAGGLRLIISQRLLPTADRSQLCAAAEVLPGSLPLWNLIRENRTYQIASLQQRGKSLGIVRLDDSLVQLVKSGRTTLALAKEVAEAPEQVEAMVLGRPLPMAAQTQAEAKAVAAGSSRAAAAMNKTVATASAAPKKGMELGKEVLSRAGKLFGG